MSGVLRDSSGFLRGPAETLRVATPGGNKDRRLTNDDGATEDDTSSSEGGVPVLYIPESLVGSNALCNATSSAGEAVTRRSCNSAITELISILALLSRTVGNLLFSALFTLVDEDDVIPVRSQPNATLEGFLDGPSLPRMSESGIDSKDGLNCVSGNAPMKFCRSDCRLVDVKRSSIEALKVKS